MIVVTMTSWVKRIGNVKGVVESIMNNTLKPDRVYLNLSKTEFDGIDLPNDLVKYFESDEHLIINWVDGENTKSMKKVFPILQYLNDDDIIIDADDDILFPKDLIETRISDFEKYDKKHPITSNVSKCGIGEAFVISPISLFQKKMLNNWEKYVNKTVTHTYNDDRTYLYILFLNGYVAKPSSMYHEKYLKSKYGYNEEIAPMKNANMYSIGRKYDEIVKETVYKLTGKDIRNSFNFFNKKKSNLIHDCVLVYGKSGIDSKEMTCGKHLEIEYAILSLKKYCSSWLGRIFVVGDEPPKQIKEYVIHIYCDNPYTHCKDANIIHKLRYACENIKDLTDDFLMVSDDQVVTKESSWEDMRPRIVRKYSEWNENKWLHNKNIDFWHKCLYGTLNLFPKNKAAFWEPHIWSPLNKYKFIEMCEKYDYKNNIDCIVQSLYYNFINQPITKQFDHIHLSKKTTKNILPLLNKENLKRHLSWCDEAFSNENFRNLLDYIVGFNNEFTNKEKINKINKYDRILQLRKDIQNGNVVKVPCGNGRFVWKKIK